MGNDVSTFRSAFIETTVNLTSGQKAFLESYFEDILHGREDFMSLSVEELVDAISKMDFDDASPAEPGKIRIANNLHTLGLLKEYDPHDTRLGRHIYLGFSETGAKVIVDLMRKAEAEGTLPKAASESLPSLSM